MTIKRFDGYPLVAVQNGNFRIDIMTDNAIKGESEIFATTDTPEKALMIVNKVNFFDDILDTLKNVHPTIADDTLRAIIGEIITKATGE